MNASDDAKWKAEDFWQDDLPDGPFPKALLRCRLAQDAWDEACRRAGEDRQLCGELYRAGLEEACRELAVHLHRAGQIVARLQMPNARAARRNDAACESAQAIYLKTLEMPVGDFYSPANGISNLVAYLAGIGRNLARRRTKADDVRPLIVDVADADADAEDEDNFFWLVNHLGGHDRERALEYYAEGLTPAEIATRHGLSRDAIYAQLNRLLVRLRDDPEIAAWGHTLST